MRASRSLDKLLTILYIASLAGLLKAKVRPGNGSLIWTLWWLSSLQLYTMPLSSALLPGTPCLMCSSPPLTMWSPLIIMATFVFLFVCWVNSYSFFTVQQGRESCRCGGNLPGLQLGGWPNGCLVWIWAHSVPLPVTHSHTYASWHSCFVTSSKVRAMEITGSHLFLHYSSLIKIVSPFCPFLNSLPRKWCL